MTFLAGFDRRRARIVAIAAVGLCMALVAALAPPTEDANAAPNKRSRFVPVQLLALNDFHGNLEPPSGSSGRITLPGGSTVDAGGAGFLATHLDTLRAGHEHSTFVAAGDLIGASPLVSALFHDEPTIQALNMMDLEITSVGNHEFDDGQTELLRMQRGGCHPDGGDTTCVGGEEFEGADFQYLSANVVKERSGKSLLPAYNIERYDGIKVAYIGMTLENTPQIVSASGIQGLEFKDEAETANKLVRKLKREKGVQSFVVLLHEGGIPTGGFNDCPGISGPIIDIADRMSNEIDAIISGHTHAAYNCEIDGKLVTSSSSFGRLVTEVSLTLDRKTNDIDVASANNVIVTRTVTPDPEVAALVEKYKTASAPIANRVIGSITADIVRAQNAAGESALGDVIADAQLEETAAPEDGGAVMAFMNPGGIRADLTFAPIGVEAAGEVTYGEMFTVQPFGNNLVTLTLTGEQIDTLLEQQWVGQTDPKPKILQVSEGFTYTWDATAPDGSKIDAASIMIGGVPVVPTDSYRVTVNSFLADGGDNFVVLREGTDRVGGVVDTDAFEHYFQAHDPVSPGPMNRIVRVN